MESKYMVVISFDAVSSEDVEVLKNLPNFKKLIENGSWIKRVDSIYPTLTYPAHTLIIRYLKLEISYQTGIGIEIK